CASSTANPDHMHLLVHYPQPVTLSKLVNSLKGVSSRRSWAEYLGKGQPGRHPRPCVVAVLTRRVLRGAPLEIVKEYIRAKK
ncbi:MAG TPA: transposase, partial [Intrasporangium sp.]|nr:transposase [Intrasporangium sp.]